MDNKEALRQRLGILEKNGLISSQTVTWIDRVLELLFERQQKMKLEKLEMFTTHLAMALQRILDGRYEKAIDRSVLEELKEEKTFAEAEAFAQQIQKAVEIEIPSVEQEYLIVHLCSLFS